MERFASVLKDLSERLTVPQPQKYRILKEIADDLEAYYEYYLGKGFSENEAAERAERKIDADDETLKLLIRLNESPFNDLIRHISARGRRSIEIACFMVLAMTVGLPQALHVIGVDRHESGLFSWPLTGLAVWLALLTVKKTFSVYLFKDHSLDSLHRHLSSILFIGLQSFLAGLAGFFWELRSGFASMPGNHQLAAEYFIPVMKSSLSILIFGTAASLSAGLIWIAFSMRILTIEEQEKTFRFDKKG